MNVNSKPEDTMRHWIATEGTIGGNLFLRGLCPMGDGGMLKRKRCQVCWRLWQFRMRTAQQTGSETGRANNGGQSYGKHSDGALRQATKGSGEAGSAKRNTERQGSMSHTIKHRADCRRVFNRYDMDCERCQQLAAGDKARPGWGDLRRKAEAQRLQAIANHDFAECARVNFICTHFEH